MYISVVILHFGSIKLTQACLNSLLSQSHREFSVVVVNNDPLLNSLELTNLSNNPLTILNTGKNKGFAAGVNLGIALALGKKRISHVLILNNDTVMPNNFLKDLTKEMCDIASPVIRFHHENKIIYDYGGKIDGWTARTSHFESLVYPDPNAKLFKSDYISGACMLISRSVFEKIGFFDERFFFYFEDVDFCMRARNSGFNLTLNQNTFINHDLSATIGKKSMKAIFYNLSGHAKLLHKHYGLRQFIGYAYLALLTGKIVLNRILKGI